MTEEWQTGLDWPDRWAWLFSWLSWGYASALNPGPLFPRIFHVSREGFPHSLVKNLPAMQETWVQPLGEEDPLSEGMGGSSMGEVGGGQSHVRLWWWITGISRVYNLIITNVSLHTLNADIFLGNNSFPGHSAPDHSWVSSPTLS